MPRLRNQKINAEEYLNKDFDYKKLTKRQLYDIMLENNIKLKNIMQLKKEELLDLYKTNIHDRLDILLNLNNQETDDMERNIASTEKQNAESVISNNTNIIEDDTEKDSLHKGMKVRFVPENKKIRINKRIVESESENETLPNTSIHSMKDEKSYTRLKKISISDKGESNISFTKKENNKNVIDSTEYNNENIKVPDLKLKHANTKYYSDSFIEKSFETPEKRNINHTLSTTKANENTFIKHIKSKRNVKKVFYIVFLVFILFFIFFKYFCPYCKNNEFFCVKLPKHAKFVNDKIICEKNYEFRKRLIFNNFCENDQNNEKINDLCTKKIVNLLREKNTKMIYGFEKSNRMKKEEFFNVFVRMFYEEVSKRLKKSNSVLKKENIKNDNKEDARNITKDNITEDARNITKDDITEDIITKDNITEDVKNIRAQKKYENIIESSNFDSFIANIQKKYTDIVCEKDFVFSNKTKFTFSIFIRYYLFPLFLYFVLTFLFLMIIFVIQKFYRENRSRKKEYEFERNKIVDEVKETLLTQKINHTTNVNTKKFVLINQFKDYFCCDAKLWTDICNNVRMNTNISEYVIHENDVHYCVWEWIGPIIVKK